MPKTVPKEPKAPRVPKEKKLKTVKPEKPKLMIEPGIVVLTFD